MTSPHPLPFPFHFNQAAFRTHRGITRCSETSLSLWLTMLEEGYCSARLDWSTARRVASRYRMTDDTLAAAVHELQRAEVCDIDLSGSITPKEAAYLELDFWTKVRPRIALFVEQ
jgi:hypothetical protein